MRVLSAVLIPVTLLAFVALYVRFDQSIDRTPPPRMTVDAEGVFTADLTLTFSARQDAFAFDGADSPTVRVIQDGRPLFETTETVAAGKPLDLGRLEGVTAGTIQFVVEVLTGDASAADPISDPFDFSADPTSASATEPAVVPRGDASTGLVSRAVRLRLFRDGQPLAEGSFWSEPGEPVVGSLTIDVPPLPPSHPHDH